MNVAENFGMFFSVHVNERIEGSKDELLNDFHHTVFSRLFIYLGFTKYIINVNVISLLRWRSRILSHSHWTKMKTMHI